MKKDVISKIEVLTSKAKQGKGEKNQEFQNKEENNTNLRNSLSENIRSKEQADAFKRLLHSL